MEFVKVKQEALTDNSTWNRWEKEVECDETIKNEDLSQEVRSEEVYIKNEFDESNSIDLHTLSENEVLHSVPTVSNKVFVNQRLDIGKESYVKEEPLEGFHDIPEHSKQKLYSSEICNDNQVMANNLVQHTLASNSPHTSCQICKLTYDNKADLVRHSSTHICDRKSKRKADLVTHTTTNTSERPFACDACKYKSAYKSAVVRHMKTHTGERPFACDVCKYKFSQKAHLDSHIMRTHTAERPFECDVCKKKFSQKPHLDSHMRTHIGDRPFACGVCKYRCSRKTYLDIHMRTHTGELPFACEFCNYKCARKESLVRHLRRRTHTVE